MSDELFITYEDQRRFFQIVLPELLDMRIFPAGETPIDILARLEEENLSRAKKSLRPMIVDLMVPLAHESQAKLERLSAKLADAGAPSLRLVGAWVSKNTKRVIARGVIRSDEEFEQMKGLLDIPDLANQERSKVQSMVDAYEFGA